MTTIKKLRTQLTILFTLLTCLVLFILLMVSWNLSIKQHKSDSMQIFLTRYNVIRDQITSGQILKDSWLTEQEQSCDCMIFIRDGEQLLHFSGAYESDTSRTILYSKIMDYLCGQDSFDSNEHKTFFLEGNQQDSYCVLAGQLKIPGAENMEISTKISLWVAFDYSPVSESLQRITRSYAVIFLVAAICFSFLCHFLVTLATRPTEEAINRQNEFIAAASHELRSPITVMKANLCALSEYPIPKEGSSLLLSTENEADRLKTLTDNLLLLAGSDLGITKTTSAEVALDSFLIRLYETFLPAVTSSGHKLKVCLPKEEIPTVYCDEQQLTQLFSIFIQNAIVHSESTKPIELIAAISGRKIIISVIDHGKGIPDTEKKLIFHRFYQGDKSRTQKIHFGLGLSIADELAKANHLSIEVTDTPGGGCTFSVLFSF